MLPQGGRVGDARSGKVGELEVVVLRRVRCLFNGSWRVRVVVQGDLEASSRVRSGNAYLKISLNIDLQFSLNRHPQLTYRFSGRHLQLSNSH